MAYPSGGVSIKISRMVEYELRFCTIEIIKFQYVELYLIARYSIAHSVDFIILMFPCIKNLSNEWIKSNLIFFHVLTLIYVSISLFFFQNTLLFPLLWSILL